MVHQVLGVEPEVITGLAEAQLSFAGAAVGLPPLPDPVLLADIGGGSTELVLGSTRSAGCWRRTAWTSAACG